jgi:hypothetical protein
MVQPTAAVAGQVLSHSTGQPLRKAWVVLRKADGPRRGDQPIAATTDAEGRFELKEIPAGSYVLSATRNGYVRQTYGGGGNRRQGGATITLAAGQNLRDLVFRLVPGGVIYGRIVDEEGEPVGRVQVMLMRYAYSHGEQRLEPRESAMTNDLGEFRIFGLEPRTYYLSAKMRSMSGGGFSMNDSTMVMFGPGEAADEGYATIYYPGTHDVSAAAPIEIRAGEETRADLTLTPARTYRVRGRVVDPSGDPVQNGMVMLANRSGGSFMSGNMSQISGKDGSFDVRGVIPGAYTLTAVSHDRDDPATARQDIEVGESNLDNVNLVLTSGREVSGVVRVEGGSATSLKELSVSFTPANSGGMFMGGYAQTQVRADGSFTVKNLAMDEYIVNVSDRGPDSYLKSVRAGGEDFLYTGVNVARIKGTLEIVVSNRGAQLEGSVAAADGKPYQGATVVVVPERPIKTRRGATRTAATDQYGNFTMRGLRPGTYQLYAWDYMDDDQYRDPEFLAKYADKAVKIQVREGEQARADLRLTSAEENGTVSGN